jgi:NADH-quinone oxidoreductase subunit L
MRTMRMMNIHHGLAPGEKPHETPWVVTLPLIMLAIPSVIIGYIGIGPMLFGNFFKDAIVVDAEAHPVMTELATHFHGAFAMATHALTTPVFWLAFTGVALSWFFYMKRPDIPEAIKARSGWLYSLLENKYYFDKFNEVFFAAGARLLGRGLWKGGDAGLIDGIIVNGSARFVGWFATVVRLFQTGHIYHYAFTMIIGVFVLMTLWVTRA